MKNQALAIVKQSPSSHQAYQNLREYLQHVILRALYEQKIFKDWVFHGGTALRIIHELNRFSEDLDFHLKENNQDYNFGPIIKKIRKELQHQGYVISDSSINDKTVRSTFIRFNNLLFECGLTPHQNEKLSIKLELDTNPPQGYQIETKVVNTYFPFILTHHKIESFLSGKIHALLQRPYTKGRDFYDLIFLLSRWKKITPNLNYLNNALKQTNYPEEPLRTDNWKNIISRYIKQSDWKAVQTDVRPFLESASDIALLDKELLLGLL